MRSWRRCASSGTPLLDMSGPMPFTAVQAGFDPLFPRNALRAYWKSQYLDELSDAAIDVIAERALDRPAPLTLVNTFHMGGAIAAVDPEATAFAERSAPYMVSIDGMWDDPADDADRSPGCARPWEAIERVRQRRRVPELHRPGRRGARARASTPRSGRNLERLQQIKGVYDPENLFRLNNNIKPA